MLKVAIIGPESTGKSELSTKLANHFNGNWEPEYAREYVEKLGRSYDFEDVCRIAHYQVAREKYYLTVDEPPFVFFDTELIITKVWFMHCYGKCPDFVQEQLNSGFFDIYLLCFPDLAWEPDAVREHENDRDYFYEWYKREIELIGKPYFIVKGKGEIRTLNAINAINHFIQKNDSAL